MATTLFALLMLGSVLAAAWVEEGEVATVVTFDDAGRPFETELWVVDLDGSAWVRAANPGEDWLERMRTSSEVHLMRNGGLVAMRARPQRDPRAIEAVNRAIHEKYGFIDRVVRAVRDHSEAVAVRLDPVEGQASTMP